ncbi:alpha/beta hydrolase family protein [Ottowia sp. VDI28]|uniref:alpha/beta hydrolase family protein n=1 Tax=Ottowia sp. VDI28 TaxID=3133968 RepID=UPI003C303927
MRISPSRLTRLRQLTRWCALAALSASLVACGGGDSGGAEPPAPAPAPAPPPMPAPEEQGGLRSAQFVNTLTATQVQAALADSRLGPETTAVARYGVSNYRITYTTTDKNGQRVVASGLVSVPAKATGAASPVLSYQHATIFHNDEAPSIRTEPGEPPMVLASQGYIVVSPDYVGFGSTQDLEHPYLTAEATANAVVDLLVAAQSWRWQQGVADNGQLFLAGYSEGGYATMAAHRALQGIGTHGWLTQQVVASVPGAGPYDVKFTLDELREGLPSWLRALFNPGNLSRAPESVRNEVRRLLMGRLFPGDADVAYQTLFIDRYLADDRDAIARDHSVHLGWAPQAPVYLFHGQDDRTVPYGASVSALQALRSAGAGAGAANVSLTDCTTGDRGHLGCVPEYFEFTMKRLGSLARDL